MAIASRHLECLGLLTANTTMVTLLIKLYCFMNQLICTVQKVIHFNYWQTFFNFLGNKFIIYS